MNPTEREGQLKIKKLEKRLASQQEYYKKKCANESAKCRGKRLTNRHAHQNEKRANESAECREKRLATGLEKYLNSSLSVGQVNLKFCSPGALFRLPEFSNSLIIHDLRMEVKLQARFNVNPS